MTLKTDISSDLDTFFDTDEFAETITYAGSEIPAIVSYDENLDERTGASVAIARISVRKSDVESPAYRDEVKIGSQTWYVRNILSGDGYVWLLGLYSQERPVI